ncbi:MAG: 16S rRNA (cytidine(1402)-2'-O)-methyltransferase [Peptoniphilaceae bacterium]|nr:16S rRNA (cytidine(1402)-2'-O)-methyltransferase [Peptoniphilaceae bacterium]MDY6019430.1 16S rRNA (cytidine(1402)-2'-O)-methyltransferase [Anaerococcus sp.]
MDYSIYFVPTPIGNLEDMTIRSINVLKEVDLIACEDTRESVKLLNYFSIKKPLTSYHKFNEQKKSDELIEAAKEGKTIAIITDQGMPGISDPGHILIKKCIESGTSYTILPGASSILTALVGSGFDNDEFSYYGFVPKKASDKKIFYEKLKSEDKTSIILDTPHNLTNTLDDFKKIFPDRYLCLAREITKKFEEYKIEKISDINTNDLVIKGEFVLILSKNTKEKKISLEDYREEIESLKQENYKTKDIVKIIKNKANFSKNELYDYILSLD